jgi:hypothetical protein
MKISISTIHWFSKVDFLKTPIHSFQFEIIIPHPLQKVANGYLNLTKMNRIDSNITKSKLISYEPKTRNNQEYSIIEMEMIWVWGKPMKKRNICSFNYHHNELIFVSKPIISDENEWFSKTEKCSEYFEYEIITLSPVKDGNTKFQHIMIICSSENFDWKKIVMERGKSFLPSLLSSIQSSKSRIVEEEEKYLEMKDGEPKDAIGMMLYNLDLDSKMEDYDELSNDFSMNETSFLDDTDLMSEIEHITPIPTESRKFSGTIDLDFD